MSFRLGLAVALSAAALPASAFAQQVERGDRAILAIAPTLKAGEFVWAPELSPDGPALAIVNLQTQRLILFRNGVPIAASTVSSGKTGHDTPTGVFTILQKAKEHYSKTYNSAPMPNMQRLTWKGIALHAGNLPGYPASHGCVRLPMKFSSLLFGATSLGMTVVITEVPVGPQDSAAPELVASQPQANSASFANAAYQWHADRGNLGIVSVVVSAADQRAIVMRDGVEIGRAPVRYLGPLTMPVAYVLRSKDEAGSHWLKLNYSGSGGSMDVSPEEAKRFDAPTMFRQTLMTILTPGSVVIVTPQSLKAGEPGKSLTVIENDDSSTK
jgi:L,D-transpeptidase catalytic domain